MASSKIALKAIDIDLSDCAEAAPKQASNGCEESSGGRGGMDSASSASNISSSMAASPPSSGGGGGVILKGSIGVSPTGSLTAETFISVKSLPSEISFL